MRYALTLVAVTALAGVDAFIVAGTMGTQSAQAVVHPLNSGSQQVSSGPGVYAQTTDEYAGSWWWSQISASYDYYWYIFTSGGALAGSGHNPSGGGGSWSGTPNIYYFKEYNDEPAGSGHTNVLTVNYCC